jgi:hypothetical protein
MKNNLIAFLAICSGTAAAPVFAWGNEGHQIVALVAQRHLTPAALKAVEALLGAEGGQLDNVATWADCIKRNTACAADDGAFDQRIHPETKPWHFVDILLSANGYAAATDCANDACVVAQIVSDQSSVTSAGGDATKRLIALKFLVHFVGDVHQPLHAAYKKLPDGKSDEGGNLRFVRGPSGAKTDLHAFWDTDLVKAELADAAGVLAVYATTIDQGPAPAIGDPVAWANESHSLAAKAYAYPGVNGPHGLSAADPINLSPAYVKASRQIVRRQLRSAGIRLAALLNQALDPEGANAPVATRALDLAGSRD